MYSFGKDNDQKKAFFSFTEKNAFFDYFMI